MDNSSYQSIIRNQVAYEVHMFLTIYHHAKMPIIATSTLILCYLYLTLIFIATSHKHCAFTITYVRFGNPSLFASYAMLMRPRNLKTAANKIQRRQLARSGVSPGVLLHETEDLAVVASPFRGKPWCYSTPKRLSMASSIQAHYFYGSKVRYQRGHVPNVVASSQLLARLCYLYLNFYKNQSF